MLAAVIAEENLQDALESVNKARNADLMELRLDYLKEIIFSELENLMKTCDKPTIITIRKKSEGGFYNGSEEERIKIFKRAIDLGAYYIDIEYSSNKKKIKELIKNKNKTKIIISYHNLKETSNNIKIIYNKIKNLNRD